MDNLITKSIPEEINVIRTNNVHCKNLLYYKDVTGYERCTNKSVLNSCKKRGLASFSFPNSPTKGFEIKPSNKLSINDGMFYLSYKDTIEVEDPRGFAVNVSLLSVLNLFKYNSLDKIKEAELVYAFINTVVGSGKVFSTWYLLDTRDPQYIQIVKENTVNKLVYLNKKANTKSTFQPGEIIASKKEIYIYLGKMRFNKFVVNPKDTTNGIFIDDIKHCHKICWTMRDKFQNSTVDTYITDNSSEPSYSLYQVHEDDVDVFLSPCFVQRYIFQGYCDNKENYSYYSKANINRDEMMKQSGLFTIETFFDAYLQSYSIYKYKDVVGKFVPVCFKPTKSYISIGQLEDKDVKKLVESYKNSYFFKDWEGEEAFNSQVVERKEKEDPVIYNYKENAICVDNSTKKDLVVIYAMKITKLGEYIPLDICSINKVGDRIQVGYKSYNSFRGVENPRSNPYINYESRGFVLADLKEIYF